MLFDLISLLVILIAALLFAAWIAAGRIVRRRKPDPTALPDSVGVAFEHVTFNARDGLELGGRLSGDGATRPTVILCAGQFGSMDGDTPLVPVLVRAGFNVLQFDWRGHGISDGQRTTLGLDEVHDLRGAIDYLQAQGMQRIGLLGFSMGGAVALRTAAADQRVHCVVADGPFADVQHTLEGALKSRLGLKLAPVAWLVLRLVEVRLGMRRLAEASPLETVGGIQPRPVMFIHGGADPLVPVADQEALYNACGSPKTLWRVEGAGHREAVTKQPGTYHRRVTTFFQENL